ncbi:MAG: hypothetical protein WC343_00950 [Bacilli bacterium]|jgi:hypothetical protein
MGEKVNRYTLNIILCDTEKIPLAKGPLEMIDDITTCFRDKKDFLRTIASTLKIKMDLEKANVCINYIQDKEIRETGAIYLNNKMDLAVIKGSFLKYLSDENFIIKYVQRYCNSPFLSGMAKKVIEGINEDTNYSVFLQQIIDKTFSSYKAIRDICPLIEDYEKQKGLYNYKYTIPCMNKSERLIQGLNKLKLIYDYNQLTLLNINSELKTDNFGEGTSKVKIKKEKKK